MRLDDDKFNLMVQQLYHSPRCQFFYIFLFVLSACLILITIADGFKVTSSFGFIAVEALLNVLIAADFACRMKLIGTDKFFKRNHHIRWWNVFDCLVVCACILLFIASLISKLAPKDDHRLEAGTEEVLLVLWAVW